MSKDKVDLAVEIKTEYDGKGAAEAQQDMSTASAAAQKEGQQTATAADDVQRLAEAQQECARQAAAATNAAGGLAAAQERVAKSADAARTAETALAEALGKTDRAATATTRGLDAAATASERLASGAARSAGGVADLGSAAAAAAAHTAAAAEGAEELAGAEEDAGAAAGEASAAESGLGAAHHEAAAGATAAAGAEQQLTTARRDGSQAAADAASARQAAAAVTAAEEQQSAQLQKAMALEALGAQKLEALLRRLIAARQAAAKAGDAKAYEAISARCDEVRGAMERMKQGVDLNKVGMINQAQAGLQLGQTLGSIGEKAASGTLGLTDLVGGVNALAMAAKAGMGPIGLLMATLEQLPMVWKAANIIFDDKWNNWADGVLGKFGIITEHAQKKEQDAMDAQKAKWEAEEQAYADRQQVAKGEMNAAAAAFEKQLQEQIDGLQKEAEKSAQEREKAAAEAEQEEEKRRIALDAELEMQQQQIALRQAGGEMSAEQAAAELYEIQRQHDERMAGIDQEAAKRKKAAQDAAATEAFAQRTKIRDALKTLDGMMEIKLPTAEEYTALQDRIAKNLYSADTLAQRRAWNEEIDKVRGVLHDMGINYSGSEEDILAFVQRMRGIKDKGEATEKELLNTHRAAAKEAKETERGAEQARLKAEADAGAAAAARRTELAQEAAARRGEEWEMVQRTTLPEQEAWLTEQLAHLQEGSEEAKRWAKELQQVRAKEVQEGLSDITKELGKVATYAHADQRTQADIWESDERTLKESLARLQALRATPDLDAATIKQINEQEKEVRKNLRNLRDTWHRGALDAQRAVEGMKPAELTAAHGKMRGSLRLAERRYAALARQAERQARYGDTDALQRTEDAMRRTALQQERITGYSGQAAATHRETLGNLKAIATGTAAEERGMTASQKQRRNVERALGEQVRQLTREAKEDREATQSAADLADARKRATRAAERMVRNEQQQGATAGAADVTAQMTEATTMLRELQTTMTGLAQTVAQLASAATSCAAAAREGATAAEARLNSLGNEVSACKKAISNLKR